MRNKTEIRFVDAESGIDIQPVEPDARIDDDRFRSLFYYVSVAGAPGRDYFYLKH